MHMRRHPSAGAWQVMAAETVISTGRGAIQSSPVLCRGTACTAVPTAEGCVLAALCVRQAVRQSVQGSRQACAGTEGQLLFLLPWLTKRRPVCGQHAEATARGASAQRHRSASLAEEKPASREAPQQHTSRRHRSAALVETLCPYEKELQQPGRAAHVIAAALNNPALHAVFEEPKRKRARSRAQGSTRGR
ncbi:Ribose 5-phosphate isomerase [Giardia duodenalis]|uniref:Ribose 5-phosphate isomerase n=1 Tax=Giardia intestinalis TaxID=5741 RepID=V6TU60_GIAIN|nr:Ribose 5-phosphate isomerase [Giardia intestinalis]